MEQIESHDGFAPDFSSVIRSEQPSFMRELRSKASDHFAAEGLPKGRDEAWRFTPVSSVSSTPFETRTGTSLPRELGIWTMEDCHRMVFVDGRLVSTELRAEGLTITNLGAAAQEHAALVERHLGSLADSERRSFVALNTALLQDGAFVHLSRGARLEQPLHLIFVSSSAAGPTASYPRNLFVLDDHAEATIVETHLGDDGEHLSCPVGEVVLGRGARLRHHRIQEELIAGSHVATLHVRQQAASTYASTTLSMGAPLQRNEVHVQLKGEGAHCSLDGLYLPRARQQVDNYLRIEHTVPHCTSDQLYKGVLSDRARSVFTGTVVVAEDAQKTDARQSNRNLLLSDNARAHSNPQLEIFADDVRCTHGSATGKLDQEAIFYLRSRGIGRAEAEQLLVHAFAAEVVGRTELPLLEQRLSQLIGGRLPLAKESGADA